MIVGSIGIGLLILIIVWILALITFVIGVKFQNNVSWIALGVATTLTAILVLIPTEKRDKPSKDLTEKDYALIYRWILLSFVLVSALLASIAFFLFHCIEPIRPKAVKQFYET